MIRVLYWRYEWFPYRGGLVDLQASRETDELVVGPYRWFTPRRLPWLWSPLCRALNRLGVGA